MCAVIAFVGIAVFLGSQQSGTAGQEPTTQRVLVALEAIEVGEQVTPDKVEAREVPADAVAGTALGDPSLLGNRPAVFAVAQGQQVNEETFGRMGPGRFEIASQLRAGEKAVAFQVDRVTGLDFVLEPGDVIDLVISVDVAVVDVDDETGETGALEGLGNQRTVKTVLQGRRVLYVSDMGAFSGDPDASPDPEGEPVVQADQMIIIIAGTDQDAELIKFAQRDIAELGAITVTLRAPGDDQVEQTTGVTLDRLITDYGVPVPNVVILPETTPAP